MPNEQHKNLAIGAIVSFQCKFLHPHPLRDAKFPILDVGQRLSNARAVRRALKKINNEPVVYVVVEHDDFKNKLGRYQEIWCNQNHIRIEKEGDPKLVFEGYEGYLEQNTIEKYRGYFDKSVIEAKPLATVREVFSFAKSSKAKANIVIGLFASFLCGGIQPGRNTYHFLRSCSGSSCALKSLSAFLYSKLVAIAIVFADVFRHFSDGSDEVGVRKDIFVLVIIGVYAFVTMTLQTSFLETAATEMTDNMKQEWLNALLRQDIAYFDVMDISSTATIISINGMKFRR
jgi:hypothetical protein